MKQKTRTRKRVTSKAILRLPDLEVAKSAVLSSLSCPDAQRGYRHAIDEFVDWYCSEPRLSFSKTVVVRLSDASRVAQARTGHDQPSARSSPSSRVRGRGLRTPERRLGRRNTASQGR
jgi:hypothetical protein